MTAQQLKNSILQMAVQGKLVAQNPNDESAKTLLERIQKEKAQLVKDKKIKKDKVESHIFKRDGSYFERVDGVEKCIDEELPFDIPESWEWCRLGNCLDVRDGTHDTPQYVTTGFPLVTSKNLENGKINFSTAKLISEENMKAINLRSKVDDDDLLFAMIGSIGNPVLYRGKEQFSIKNMALFKNIGNCIFMKCLFWWLFFFQDDMKKNSSGGVQAFVSLTYLREYLIPLPPLEEQKRIVAKIEEVLPHIQDYENAHSKIETLNKDFPEKLKKSVLQWAVQGKLVAQNPNDESAKTLLERIQKEKAQLIKDKKIKKDKVESHIFKRDGSYFEAVNGVEKCIDEELPFAIPESWEWVRLGSVSKNLSAGGDKPAVFSETKTDVCYVPIFSNGEKNKGLYGYTNEAKIFEKSITISGRGTIGFSCIREEPYVPIVRLITVTTFENISIDYLHFVFSILFEKGIGTSIPQLTVPMVIPKLIPLPPLAEQERIVAKIEEVLEVGKKL